MKIRGGQLASRICDLCEFCKTQTVDCICVYNYNAAFFYEETLSYVFRIKKTTSNLALNNSLCGENSTISRSYVNFVEFTQVSYQISIPFW